MCIIVAKPAGIDIPLEETFNNCFTSNKDGIGISFNMPNETVHIAKGFTNVSKLMKVLDSYNITKEHNLIVHFRFATHGKKDAGNCHPFPLTGKYEEMRWTNLTCGCAIAHNGVFSGMPQHNDHSDTMKFIGGVLAQPEIVNNLDSKSVKELLRGYCGYGSKLAFLRSTGINLVGDFEKEDGVYYSNNQFKRTVYHSDFGNDKYQGKSYCYVHKEYDECTYCREHKTYDLCHESYEDKAKKWKDRFKDSCCETGKEIRLIGSESDPFQSMMKNKCLWCLTVDDNVKWDEEAEGWLCESCSILLANQNKDY